VPTDQIEKLTSDLPPVARARIELADTESVATLLAALAQFWRSSVTLKELIQHRPEELYPLFVQYAQSKFDQFAEELLSYSKAEKYRVDLEEVISSIYRDICPETSQLHPNGRAQSFSELWDSGNWDSLFSSEIRQEIPGYCEEGGEWEMYVGRSLDDHWEIRGYQDVKQVAPNAKGPEGRLAFIQLMYHFHLRLSPNYQKFKWHLHASLSQRADLWEARLNLRIAENEAAKQLRESEKNGSPSILEESKKGAPSLSLPVDFQREQLHRRQAEQLSGVLKIEIPVPEWASDLATPSGRKMAREGWKRHWTTPEHDCTNDDLTETAFTQKDRAFLNQWENGTTRLKDPSRSTRIQAIERVLLNNVPPKWRRAAKQTGA
jgi:hypothetical protein